MIIVQKIILVVICLGSDSILKNGNHRGFSPNLIGVWPPGQVLNRPLLLL